MTAGDVAASIGIPTVPAGEDIRLGAGQMNRILDVIAQHFISGTHPASAISTGVLDNARIPGLDAGALISGLIELARIPSLDAAKITTGIFAAARMPNISANSIVGGNLDIADAGGTVRAAQLVTPGNLTAAGVRTTGLSGFQTVVTNASGAIGVSSSSARFKQDIRPAAHRSALLTADLVKEYRYRSDVAELGDAAPIYRGVIAEQLHDLGLFEYVIYDDEGAPFSVHYEFLVLDLIQIVQDDHLVQLDHARRLKALENKGKK